MKLFRLALMVLTFVAPAFSQPDKGSSEIGLDGAVIVPHIAPSDTTGLVSLNYGYYFRRHDLAGINSIMVFSKDVQDVYLLARYRHLFSTGNPMIFPFIGAGGGVNVFASTALPTSHWALGSGEAGVKFYVSHHAAFDVTYNLFYVKIQDASFKQASFSAVTFGFTYSFGGKNNTSTPTSSLPPSSEPVGQRTQRETTTREQSPGAQSAAAIRLPVLGVGVVSRGMEGAEIVEVVHSSLADLAGLQDGDVINGVDGKSIKSPAELAAALSDKAAGTKVILAFLVRGYWQSETTIVLGDKQ